MLLFAQHADWGLRGAILAGVIVNLALTLIVFLIAARVSQLMSATLAAIVTKVFVFILAALAAQFTIDGINSVFGLARRQPQLRADLHRTDELQEICLFTELPGRRQCVGPAQRLTARAIFAIRAHACENFAMPGPD